MSIPPFSSAPGIRGPSSADNQGIVRYSGTSGKIVSAVIGGPIMDDNGRVILKNTNERTVLLLNNVSTTGASAPLANEILYQPNSAPGVFDTVYGYGVMSWYCDDTSLKDVIMQAHHHLDSDPTDDHHHFSLYTSNAARSSTIKRFNVQYREDYALMDFQNTYLTISNVGSNTALNIDLSHDATPGDAIFIRDVSGGRVVHVTKDAQWEFIGLFAADSTMRYAVTGDTTDRALVKADGTLQWGDGTNPIDTKLYRSAAGTLKTDGTLVIGSLSGVLKASTGTVSGSATLTDVGTPTADFSMGSHKITSLTNGSAASDAAAFGQIPTSLPPSGSAGGGLTGTYPNPTVATNANLTGVITSSGNATSIASQTGTGTKFVVDTSPTLVTPVLGAATGTSLALTNTSATGLAVGANGATNPVLQIDSSTASVATGLLVKGAAAAGGLALSVITSGTNENLKIDAAGSGTISIGSVSTGAITLTRATTANSTLSVLAGTAPAAGGSIAMKLGSSGGGGPQIVVGSGVPTISAVKGSLYLRTDGTTTNDRIYVNSSGSTTWTAITTVA